MGGVLATNRATGSFLAFVLLVVTFVVSAPQAAQGATFSVNSADPSCTSTGPVYCEVEDAVRVARFDTSGPPVISVSAGTYDVTATMALDFDVTIEGLSVVDTSLRWTGATNDRMAIANGASVTLRNLEIDGNSSGGAVQADNGAALTMSDASVSFAQNGGAGGAIQFDGTSTGTLTRMSIVGNAASDVGGGVAVLGGSTVAINSSVVDSNSAGVGGGLYVEGAGSVANVVSSTVSSNTGGAGAGGHATNGGKIDLRNSTVSGNTGDGVYATTTGILYLLHATVASNTGVGVVSSVADSVPFDSPGNVVLARTLVADNVGDGTAIDCANFVGLAAFNLIGNNLGCTLGTQGPNDIVGTPVSPVEALLSPLAQNGGATPTHALVDASPAVDSADPFTSCLLPGDQRGTTRPQRAACDIGAFELGRAGLTLQQMIDATPDGGTLTVPDGTYLENVMVSRGVQLRGAGPDTVIIRGNDIDATVTVNSDTTIEGIRVTDGGDSGIKLTGPYNVTLDDLVVDNSNAFRGGGLFAADGTVTLTNSNFNANTANFGGAIASDVNGTINIGPAAGTCNDGALAGGPNVFLSNTASSDGGAIEVRGTVNVADGFFRDNAAGDGGALYYDAGANPSSVSCTYFETNSATANGGAISGNDDADVTISDSRFVSNTAGSRGGAIADFVEGTRLTIDGSIFESNSADISGGAIITTSAFVGTNNAYTQNSVNQTGGAISVEACCLSSGDFASTGSQFSSNTSGFAGGAIFVSSAAQVTVDTAVIENNTAGYGAGLYNATAVAITDSTFEANVATQLGGGIYNEPNTTLNLSGSLLRGNDALRVSTTAGGGIGGAGDSVITNSTFNTNSAPNGDGGGIGLEAGSADVSFVSFVGNTAAGFGGAFNGETGSTISLLGTAAQGNSSQFGPLCASFVSVGFNVSGGNPSLCTLASTDVIGTTGFEPLADNGGPTLTHALGVNSPAVDVVVGGLALEPITANSPLTVNGVAGFGPAEELRLTDSFFQASTAFWSEAYPAGTSFDVTFDVVMDPVAGLGGETSGDGITFVIANDPTVLGNEGGAIGIGGVPNVVSFEMDTYDGTPDFGDDIDGNHIAINVGDTVESPNANQVPVSVPFDNGAIWTANVSYDAATTVLTAEVFEGGVSQGVVSETVDLSQVVDAQSLYFGFSSATGGAAAIHDVLSWTVTGCNTAVDQRGVVRPQGAACDAGAYELTQTPGLLTSATLVNNSDGFVEMGVVDIPITDIPIEKVTGAQSDSPAEPSPLSTIPLSTIPLSTIDLNASPLSTIPLSTIPLSTIPLSTIAINGAPLSTIPLSTIPLSTIAGGWDTVLAGTTYEGTPLQSITLDEIDPLLLDAFGVSLGDLTIQGSPLSTISLPTLALGDASVAEINAWLAGPTVCGSIGAEYECSDSDTLLNLEIQGAPLSTIPLSTIPLSTIPLSTIPLSTIPLSTIPLSTIPLSTIPLSTITVKGLPLSTIEMQDIDVSGAPISTIPLSTIPLSTIDLLVAPISTIPLSTIPLSTIPLSTIDVDGQVFCDFFDAGATAATTCAALGINPDTDGLGDLIQALGVADPTLTIGASPLSTIPLSTIDVSSAPLSTIDFTDPVVQSSPLSTIPLSTILINGDPVCDFIADIPAQTCGDVGINPVTATFVELAAAYGGIAASPLSTIPLSTIDLESAPLSTIDITAVMINGAPISTIPLSTIDIINSPLSTIPLSTIDMLTSPLSTIPLSTINILGSPLSTIPLSTIPLSTISCTPNLTDCQTLGDVVLDGTFTNADTLGLLNGMYGEATLGDLVGAFGALTINDIAELLGGMTLGDLVDALTLAFLFGDLNLGEANEFGNLTFGQLLIALMLRSDFPWESIPLDQLDPQEYSADNWLVYSLRMATLGEGPDIVSSPSITIPEGFYYEPGSAVVNTTSLISSGPGVVPPFNSTIRPVLTGTPLDEPSMVVNADGSQTLTFEGVPIPLSMLTSVSIVTVPSMSYGQKDASADVAFGPEPSVAADATNAAVYVYESSDLDPGDDPTNPAATDPDVLYVGHISYSEDVDYFEITPPNVGDRVVVFMSNLDADGDLVLYKPLSAAEQPATAEVAPELDGIPIEDDGVSFGTNTTEEPNTLEDIPLEDLTIAGVSTNRGTLEEEASAISTGDPFTIQASMYNGATTQDPFVLRVKVNPEVPTPQCTPRGWASVIGSPANSTFGTVGPTTNSVFLMNWERIAQTEGVAEADAVRDALNTLAARSDLGIEGVVIDVGDITGVDYTAWDANPCDAAAANDVVDAIVGYLDTLPLNVTYITIAGSDEVIPFDRKVDETAIANESTFAGEFSDNAMYGSLVTRHFLSDDAYGDLDPVQWLDRLLNVPDRSVGRLVESSGDIVNAVATFQDFGGFLDPQTALTVGYDFLSDSSEDIEPGVC